ncbi:SprB repeat-containing protein [Hymenobacter psychrotolerans]|nr:SprB repeat-containing protein [Hymenobacter psychrotolerans]
MVPEQGVTGDWVQIWLDGAYHQFTAFSGGTLTGVPAYGIFNANYQQTGGRDGVISDAMRVVQERITSLSLPYTVREHRSPAGGVFGNMLLGFIIEATLYDLRYDFQPCLQLRPGLFSVSAPIGTIRPVFVDQDVTPAGIFGSATGAITLTARNGNNGVYTYTWADGPTTASRSNLRAGRYTCVVADSSGVSLSVTILVRQDDQLEVVVDRYENDVTLRVSGGRAPYTFLWDNGTTEATRPDLEPGTYTCRITDSVGATDEVSVTISEFQFYFSLNPIVLPMDAGPEYREDPGGKPNLSFCCEVYIEPEYMSGNFVRIGEPIEQPADRHGRTRFEVQTLLDTYLQEHLPELGQRDISRADSLFKRFYLLSWERYGEPAEDGPQQLQQTNYVVLGGLDFFEYPSRTWFNTYQAAVKPFLTWQPNDRNCHPEQPEYLYFMADSFALAAFSVRVRVSCTDGSSEEFIAGTYPGPRRYEVFCLPVGFEALVLRRFDSPTRRVLSWSVQVVDDNGVPQSEERRYRLDYRYFPQKRYFLYTNSLGGVNTLACTGEATGTLTPVQEEAQRGPNPGHDPQLGDAVVLDRSGTMVLNVQVGALTRGELLGLQDFVLSRRVTMVRDGFYWPGKVKPKAFEAFNDGDTTRSYAFDFELPRQRVFTPRLPVATSANTRPVAAGEGGQL